MGNETVILISTKAIVKGSCPSMPHTAHTVSEESSPVPLPRPSSLSKRGGQGSPPPLLLPREEVGFLHLVTHWPMSFSRARYALSLSSSSGLLGSVCTPLIWLTNTPQHALRPFRTNQPHKQTNKPPHTHTHTRTLSNLQIEVCGAQ